MGLTLFLLGLFWSLSIQATEPEGPRRVVDPVFNLDPKPNRFHMASPPSEQALRKTELPLSIQAHFQTLSTGPDHLKDFNAEGGPRQAIGLGVRGRGFLNWDFPLQFGLALDYSYHFISYDEGPGGREHLLNLGPLARVQLSQTIEHRWYLIFGVQWALLRRVQLPRDELNLNLSSYQFLWGVEYHTPWREKKILMGLEGQFQRVGYRASDNPAVAQLFAGLDVSDNASVNTLLAYLGVEFESFF